MNSNQIVFGIIGAFFLMFYFKWPEFDLIFLPAATWFFYSGIVSRTERGRAKENDRPIQNTRR